MMTFVEEHVESDHSISYRFTSEHGPTGGPLDLWILHCDLECDEDESGPYTRLQHQGIVGTACGMPLSPEQLEWYRAEMEYEALRRLLVMEDEPAV